MKSLIFVFYYLVSLALTIATEYMVFYKGISPWWWILTMSLIILWSPTIKEND